LGRRRSVEWQVRIPDLTPLDFFYLRGGHVKTLVYAEKFRVLHNCGSALSTLATPSLLAPFAMWLLTGYFRIICESNIMVDPFNMSVNTSHLIIFRYGPRHGTLCIFYPYRARDIRTQKQVARYSYTFCLLMHFKFLWFIYLLLIQRDCQELRYGQGRRVRGRRIIKDVEGSDRQVFHGTILECDGRGRENYENFSQGSQCPSRDSNLPSPASTAWVKIVSQYLPKTVTTCSPHYICCSSDSAPEVGLMSHVQPQPQWAIMWPLLSQAKLCQGFPNFFWTKEHKSYCGLVCGPKV